MIAEEYFGALLLPTVAPWKIAGDPPTKIFAMRGPVSQYKYGTGYGTSQWPPGWQKAFVTSPESGLIVMDRDADGFEELMARRGIPLSLSLSLSLIFRPHRPGRRDPVLLRRAAPVPRRLAGTADPCTPPVRSQGRPRPRGDQMTEQEGAKRDVA